MKAPVFFMVFFMSGCSVIHFDKGEQPEVVTTQVRWHHNLAFATYEASAPVNPQTECAGRHWTSVTTKLSYANILAAASLNAIAGPASLATHFWYPKTVEVSCAD